MNIYTVDAEMLYRAQESTWKWLQKVFSSSESGGAAAADAAATETAAAGTAEDAVCACYDDWRMLRSLEAGQSSDRTSDRWTLGKE